MLISNITGSRYHMRAMNDVYVILRYCMDLNGKVVFMMVSGHFLL